VAAHVACCWQGKCGVLAVSSGSTVASIEGASPPPVSLAAISASMGSAVGLAPTSSGENASMLSACFWRGSWVSAVITARLPCGAAAPAIASTHSALAATAGRCGTRTTRPFGAVEPCVRSASIK
jgi:hypothetical protein